MARSSRRAFLRAGGAGALTVGLAACTTAPSQTAPTPTAPAQKPAAAQTKPAQKPAGPPTQAPTQPTTAPTRPPAPTPAQAAQSDHLAVAPDRRTLVVIQLGGGDDGLNLLA